MNTSDMLSDELAQAGQRCDNLRAGAELGVAQLFDASPQVRAPLKELFAHFWAADHTTEDERLFSNKSPTYFGWVEVEGLAQACIPPWRDRLALAASKPCGPYTRRALGTGQQDMGTARQLGAVVQAVGRGYARLYGTAWEDMANEFMKALQEQLRRHSALGQELARREEWWVTAPQAVAEFTRAVFQKPEQRPSFGDRLWGAIATFVLRAKPPEPPALPALPPQTAIPRNPAVWGVLQVWYAHCGQEAQALGAAAVKITERVKDLEAAQLALSNSKDAACELDSESLEAVLAKNSRYPGELVKLQLAAVAALQLVPSAKGASKS